jgi:hypothetical protein
LGSANRRKDGRAKKQDDPSAGCSPHGIAMPEDFPVSSPVGANGRILLDAICGSQWILRCAQNDKRYRMIRDARESFEPPRILNDGNTPQKK